MIVINAVSLVLLVSSHLMMSTYSFTSTTFGGYKLSTRTMSRITRRNLLEEVRPSEITTVVDTQQAPVKVVDIVDSFCRWTNSAFRNLTIAPVRDYLEIMPAENNMTFIQKLKSPPQYPGISRPVSLTIAASVPTALGWSGFYKFSVEEELFQDELRNTGKVTGCGGYGTLLPFVFLFLIGSVTHFLPFLEDFSNSCIEAGGIWILLGQINLYRRVNELCEEKFGEAPLHSWWALLPPPLDVVVGLRQVHFLAKYWAEVRGEDFPEDVFADKLFPFISSDRFTLKEFVLQPKRWFWFTSEAEDFKIDL